MTTAELLPEILKLSPDDQRVIAETLWQRLRGFEPADETEFKRELDRCVADADQHPDHMIPWDEALRQLRAAK